MGLRSAQLSGEALLCDGNSLCVDQRNDRSFKIPVPTLYAPAVPMQCQADMIEGMARGHGGAGGCSNDGS
jgi:hypothetical protein